MKSSEIQRTIIVGDVHGCLEELDLLITKVNYSPEIDSLYFLGDIINRGPYSKESFFRVLELGGRSVLGNHEWQVLSTHKNRPETAKMTKLRNEFGSDFKSLLQEIAGWPLYIETDEFILVHAGLAPGKHPAETDPGILTAIRTWDGEGKNLSNPDHPPWFDLYTGSKLVVFGHWASLDGVVRKNVIGLDTGCVYGKKLSALILPERRIVTVKAKRTYRPIE
jgi:bis(5'-nucleosyl)-tetraphosphatase (symmetrical)